MFLTIFIQFSLILLWQTATPTPSPQPSPVSLAREIWTAAGDYLLPVALVAQLVALAYFFWHSKNREELTKALAEATSLANTRGEKIKDLDKEVSEQASLLATKEALLIASAARIKELEDLDEKRAKKEFTLRAEIADLERQLGIKP